MSCGGVIGTGHSFLAATFVECNWLTAGCSHFLFWSYWAIGICQNSSGNCILGTFSVFMYAA